MNQIDAKIILLGDSGVGKTSLLNRYINNQFENTKATIGAFFLLKVWRGYNLGIWDTAGQEKYNALGGFYCRNTKAAILMYDITAEESFKKIQKYLDLLESENSGNDVFLVLVGSKLDLVQSESKGRQVAQGDAQQYAASINAQWFETSAKTGHAIEDVFNCIGVRFFGETSRPTFTDLRKNSTERRIQQGGGLNLVSPNNSPQQSHQSQTSQQLQQQSSQSPQHSPSSSSTDLVLANQNNALTLTQANFQGDMSPSQESKCCQ